MSTRRPLAASTSATSRSAMRTPRATFARSSDWLTEPPHVCLAYTQTRQTSGAARRRGPHRAAPSQRQPQQAPSPRLGSPRHRRRRDRQQRAHVRGPLSTSAVCCRQATGAATGRTQFRKTFSEQTLMAPLMNSIRQRRPEVRELPPNRRTRCAVLGRRDNVTVASTSATPDRGHCPVYPAVFPPRGSLPRPSCSTPY